MPKRTWTPEQRAAAADRMRAMHQKKHLTVGDELPSPSQDVPGEDTPSDLLKRIEELAQEVSQLRSQQASQASQTPQIPQTPQVDARGSLIGTFEKYLLDPKNYPDPTDRLSKEPRLERFAFPANYELKYSVHTSTYETRDGINTVEPRFEVELHGIIFDDDGEPTNRRYTIRRLIFHEDPQAALIVARNNNFDVESLGEMEFLNEMRYLRIRDWLLDAFYTPKVLQDKVNKTESVIGNRLVEVFEINSENPERIPFEQLNKKL